MNQNHVELYNRAIAAYYKYSDGGTPQQPSEADSGVAEHEGKQYVVLRNVGGVLAVYRIRKYDGVLKRMQRWPAAIELTTRQPKTHGELRSQLADTLVALVGGDITNAEADAITKKAQQTLKAQ